MCPDRHPSVGGRARTHPLRSPLARVAAAALLVAQALLVPGVAAAGSSGGLQDFDARIEHNLGFSAGAAGAAAAPSDAALTRDPTTGATRTIMDPTGYLTGPSAAPEDPSTAAMAYLNANLPLLGLSAADLADHEITDVVHSQVSGSTHIYLRQVYQGIAVYGAQLQVNVSRDGRILGVNNSFLPNIAQAGLDASLEPLLDADVCSSSAALQLGLAAATGPSISQRGPGPSHKTQVNWEGVSSDPIIARLMWLPIRAGDLRLVWNFQLQPIGAASLFDFTVDATSGQVWTRFDWTSDAGYRAFSLPVESPNHTTLLPPLDGRVLVLNPEDPLASPDGWHALGVTTMRGNNVHSYDDRTANNQPPASEPSCGPSLVCDFTLDLTAQPANSVAASVANLFYWTNTIHDIQYQYGFDEAAGNFQVDNFGRGGIGSDDVRAETQDGGGNCNANMLTLPDGSRPRLQMFNCANSNPANDGAYDNGIIAHEYAHGITNRQVGGPSITSCLANSQQPGEGWSDAHALIYTAKTGDLGPDPRTVGTYLFSQPASGPGLRTRPYSTDPAVNPFTYASINGQSIPHGVGSVWAQVLWKMYWALVDVYGFDPALLSPSPEWVGNHRTLLYINEGLKFTACSPTFTDARDGIIQAAVANFGGEDVCTLWEVFANFGLGTNAVSGGPNSTSPVNGFLLPPECQVPGNAPPTVSITSPANGTTFASGVQIPFTGSASDLEDGNLTTSLVWSSSLSGNIGTGGSFLAPLAVGTHNVTAAVSDSVGAPASSSIVVSSEAAAPNTPPVLTVTSPQTRDRFRDESAVFSATAIDTEDGDISHLIAWSSDIDGTIGQGGNFQGSLSDGRHQIVARVFDSSGAIAQRVINRVECKGTCQAPTPTPQPPFASFNANPISGIAPLVVSFINTSIGNISSFAWNFGDGETSNLQSPNHTYNAAGTFTARLTTTGPDGTSSANRIISVAPALPTIDPPVALLGASVLTGDAPLTVLFTGLSSGTIIDRLLDFGDGSQPSADPDVSHTYTAPGSYAATLTVTNSAGSSTSVQTISVNAPLVADFVASPTAGSTPLTVNFSDRSIGDILARSWVFGDGGTSQAINPSHTYTTAGTFTVVLAVSGPTGTSTAVDTITTSEPVAAPVAGIIATPTSGQAPLTVTFTSSSTGAITTHAWGFGDGAVSSELNPVHTYTSAGSFLVVLTVTGPAGSSSTSVGIEATDVPQPPQASFSATPTSGQASLTVNFTDTSTGTITGRLWEFEEGASSTAVNPVHVYTTAGIFSPTLTVTGPNGSTSASTTVNVTSAPQPLVADFSMTPSTGPAPLTVSFTDLSTGGPTGFSWIFDAGNSSTEQHPTYTFVTPGTFSVILGIARAGGESAAVIQPITVTAPTPAPVASFSASPTSGTSPLDVAFNNTSSGNITSQSWTFGDGGTSTQVSPTHTYNGPGDFTATLTVTGPGGSDTASTVISVAAPILAPVASFSASPTSGTSPLAVAFTNNSSGNITEQSWTFGDGGTSTQASPNHTYNGPGDFTATLTVTGPGGSDTASTVISVAAPPTQTPELAVSVTGPGTVNRGQNASFTVTVTNVGASTVTGAQLSFSTAPNRRVRRFNLGGVVGLPSLPPGASWSQTWTGRADKQGTATATAVALDSSGISIGSGTHPFTVQK